MNFKPGTPILYAKDGTLHEGMVLREGKGGIIEVQTAGGCKIGVKAGDIQPVAAVAEPPPALSPVMQQYQQFKKQQPTFVLFFRMGDFYETFFEDAVLASKVLGITLTKRMNAAGDIPMAGVPYHAVEGYLRKMIAAGHKVAICEPVEARKGERQITRVEGPPAEGCEPCGDVESSDTGESTATTAATAGGDSTPDAPSAVVASPPVSSGDGPSTSASGSVTDGGKSAKSSIGSRRRKVTTSAPSRPLPAAIYNSIPRTTSDDDIDAKIARKFDPEGTPPLPFVEQKADGPLNYEAFLGTKLAAAPTVGFDVGDSLNPQLKDFQSAAVRWSCKIGRAALFEGTGLGKTFQELEWARQVCRHTGGDVLILTPLAVGRQTAGEAEKFGIDIPVTLIRESWDVKPGINILNYQSLHKIDAKRFAGVVLDECFASGTRVDTFVGNAVIPTPIECIRVGDSIANASGIDIVSDVHRREVAYAVRIRYAGKSVVCSPNHPFFTQRGWVGAQDLEPGDEILRTCIAMRMVREGLPRKVSRGWQVLRSVLLSEMADESAGTQGQGSHAGNSRPHWKEKVGMVQSRESHCLEGIGSNVRSESIHRSSHSGKTLPPIERDGARTFRAWGQRMWFDEASADYAGCTRAELDSGICFVVGETKSRLSDALQTRLSEYRSKNLHRSGWAHPPLSEGQRSEEGRNACFFRVEGFEVLELGHPDLEGLRDADGKLYFYDLTGTRHPSFSVAGGLVHNSGILKSFMGKTKQALCDQFRDTQYKLTATATPAPNDFLELLNQADFLGVMPANEALMRWFINDTMSAGSYRLKGHAEDDFWSWVATWAVCLTKPSDLGYSDEGYILPPLERHLHIVNVDVRDGAAEGQLYRDGKLTATTLHREMRLTVGCRAKEVAKLVAAEPDETWVIWCNTNYEADALVKEIPGLVDVRGSDPKAEAKLESFTAGKTKRLVSKPTIAGLGLNWQHAARMAFVGLSYSFEQQYQAVRRLWRFGQTRPVHCHVVCAATEGNVLATVREKEADHERMGAAMAAAMRKTSLAAGSSQSDSGRRILKEGGGDRKAVVPAWATRGAA